MNSLKHPHDRFFKDVFSRKEAVVDFLEHYLPNEIASHLELDSVDIIKDSFVDPELKASHSDMLYQVKWKTGFPVYIYILFEHKSSVEPDVAYYLLKYMVRIWEQMRKQQQQIYPILPVVFYHGEAEWHVSPTFKDLFELPNELEPYLPNFRYWLCDLSKYSDEEIQGQALLQAGLILFKHIFSSDLPERLPEIFNLLMSIVHGKTGLDYLESVFKYIVSAGKNITDENIGDAIKASIPEGGTIMSTLAQKWFDDGMQRGMQKGVMQEVFDSIELGLDLKFGSEGLHELPRIRKITNLDVLRAIRNGIKTAKSLDELRKIYQ